MNNNTVVNLDGGIGFGTMLFLIFLVLKLTNVIAWSWWWITAPLWIPAIFILVGIIIMVAAAMSSKNKYFYIKRR